MTGKEILLLKENALIKTSTLYDAIVGSKNPVSDQWSGEEYVIKNTPMQGINWIGDNEKPSAVIIRSNGKNYDDDSGLEYALKAKNNIVDRTETANKVLLNQQKYGYPILYFVKEKKNYRLIGRFAVDEIKDRSVVLKKYESFPINLNRSIPQEQINEHEAKNMQKIFFGAPGTGKSFTVKNRISDSDILKGDSDFRRSQFVASSFCKKNYKSYLDTPIPKILGKNVYEQNSVIALESCYLELKKSDDVSRDDYSSGLNGYINFARKVLIINSIFRATFHPDYDYAQFVGSYKPKKENGQITYSFVPQVFAKAYAAAWKNLNQPVYLVIEEINRGSCAQIFGDLFQLLDRKNGESEYPINADADFGQWLVDEAKVPKHEYDENGCVKIKLPPNFNILATMNTSDQSLFPMDSAFKRRFDWEYVPIQYKNPYNAEKEKEAHDKWLADKFVIDLGLKENNPKWLHFLKKVNADIYTVTQSEDKQMGEFFVKPRDGKTIDLDMFRSKVLFYLWDSVYKDEVDQNKVFHFKYSDNSDNEVTFQSLFGSDDKAIEIIKKMMENLDKAYESKDGSEFKDFKILT